VVVMTLVVGAFKENVVKYHLCLLIKIFSASRKMLCVLHCDFSKLVFRYKL
jgi:hypothetical protein